MGLFLSDLLGTLAGRFRMSKDGAQLKDDSGGVAIRDNADSTYANFRAAELKGSSLVLTPSGGARQFVKQETAGGAVTVEAIMSDEIAAPLNTASLILGEGLKKAYVTDTSLTWMLNRPDLTCLRMSIHATDPNPMPGATGDYIYIHPFNGNQVSLWDATNSAWIPRVVSSPIQAYINSATIIPYKPYDVFVFWTGSIVSYHLVQWRNDYVWQAITASTNTTTPVLTVGSGHGFAVGDLVSIRNSSVSGMNHKIFRVTATASTTITLGRTDGSALLAAPGSTNIGGTVCKIINHGRDSSLAAITITDGVPTLSTSIDANGKQYKYIGTVMTGLDPSKFVDTMHEPGIWNYWNQINRPIYWTDKAEYTADPNNWLVDTTNDTPTNWRAAGNRYSQRLWLLQGIDHRGKVDIRKDLVVALPLVVSSWLRVAFKLDAVSNPTPGNTDTSAKIAWLYNETPSGNPAAAPQGGTEYTYPLPAGFHFLQLMEKMVGAGTSDATVYEYWGSGQIDSAIYGYTER